MPRNLYEERALAGLQSLADSAASGSRLAREFLRSLVERIQRITENLLSLERSGEDRQQ